MVNRISNVVLYSIHHSRKMNEQRLDLKYCNILICSSSEDLDY